MYAARFAPEGNHLSPLLIHLPPSRHAVVRSCAGSTPTPARRTWGVGEGRKTGYTEAAGHCLVASGEKDGERRIVVVLSDTREGVWKDAEALLEWSLK